jgi:NDP-sugar pyrophosphorylase family protein
MKAIILAGGAGTRLRPLTYEVPKPLIPIQGKTLTEHQFELLKRHGIKDIVLAVGYKSDQIIDKFKDGKELGLNISYVVEDEPLGTAGCLNILKPQLNETFIMMNGDELKDIDIDKMLDFHRKNKAIITIALVETQDVESNGVVELHDKKIVRFVEKPKKEEAPSNLISSGFYIVEPAAISLIENEKFAMLEKQVFPKLAEEGKLFGYCNGMKQWFQTDNLERYERAKKGWKKLTELNI